MIFSSVNDSVDALRFAFTRGARIASCPAPVGVGQQLAQMTEGHFTVFWVDPSSCSQAERGTTFVGHGAAHVIQRTGARRLVECRKEMEAVFTELKVPLELERWVRFFGGAAFSSGRDGSGCWADFGDATFVLPQILYVDEGDSAKLIVLLPPGGSWAGSPMDGAADALGQAKRVLERALLSPVVRSSPSIGVSEKTTSADLGQFSDLVESIRRSIRSGTVDKVVTARRVTLRLSQSPNISAVLARLERDAPNCVRFAFRIGQRTFVSSTPELLIERQDLAVRTEAVAGTWAFSPQTKNDAKRELFQSTKDQHEHRYVVQALASALEPVCAKLHVPATPDIKTLARILHLWTPIAGVLHSPEHVVDLVGRLHPTPAVGGLPRQDAVSWIKTHESAERGWYSAPFGWVDSQGEGKFVVALRSALLHDNRVHLFAGAGIVRDSSPYLEYQETELKLGAMERALGIAPTSHPQA